MARLGRPLTGPAARWPRKLRHTGATAAAGALAAVALVLATPRTAGADLAEAGAPDIVARAVARMARIDVEPWTYRRVLESGDGRRVDWHEPGPDPAAHWRLESIDGRPPSEEELEEYREDQREHGRRGGAGDDDGETQDGEAVDPALDLDGDGRVSPAERVAGWFDPGSFTRSAQEPRTWTFRLRSPNGRKEQAWAQMHGELHIAGSAEAPWIDRARLWNTEPFFAALGVRMTQVSAEVRFEKVGGHIRPRSLGVAFSGRAWFVRELDESFAFSFDGWREVESAPTAGAGDAPDGETVP